MKKKMIVLWLLTCQLILVTQISVAAFEAPGSGGANWHYNQKNHHWYYYDDSRNVYTGWLLYEGEWYWFDSEGWMENSGLANIDGTRYFFFGNGHMAHNQYVGLKYYNQDGQHQEANDIRVIGKDTPTTEDRDMITDALYEIPRGWFAQFEKDGWQMMFYKKKSYFAAPSTDMGIYYVHHSVDTRYKKVKFTDTDSLLQAFGEYIGYAAGCYVPGNEYMQTLWNEQRSLNSFLNIPDYFSNDEQFYFGKLVAAYLDPLDREKMEDISPQTCEIIGDILHMRDANPEIYKKQKEEETKRRQEAAAKSEALGGPGVSRGK